MNRLAFHLIFQERPTTIDGLMKLAKDSNLTVIETANYCYGSPKKFLEFARQQQKRQKETHEEATQKVG